MAKEQGLSLNPAKISGACERLMCCLAYEHEAYDYLAKITPMQGSVVQTPDGEGVVTEVNLTAGTLKVRLDSDTSYVAHIYKRQSVRYLRGGKRAPIPEEPERAEPVDEPDAL